jgi:hypothetical protein
VLQLVGIVFLSQFPNIRKKNFRTCLDGNSGNNRRTENSYEEIKRCLALGETTSSVLA